MTVDATDNVGARDDAGATDAEVLFTSETLMIQGEAIEVHEFTFAEALSASVIARPIIAALAEASESEERDAQDFDQIIGANGDVWLDLIALNIGRPREWIEQLPDDEGMQLSLAFWGTNAGFFMKRIVLSRTIQNAMAVQARAAALR